MMDRMSLASVLVRTISSAMKCEHCDVLLWDAAAAQLLDADGRRLERAPYAMYACALAAEPVNIGHVEADYRYEQVRDTAPRSLQAERESYTRESRRVVLSLGQGLAPVRSHS